MSVLSHNFEGLAPAALSTQADTLTVETLNRIVLEQFGIEDGFGDAVLKEAEAAAPFYAANPGPRSDMRHVPFVTIDGSDAKDFDDAVFAFADPDHPGGHYIYVAVADVAHFVRPGTLVDQEAYKRGFSVYLPNRAIPMLPPVLSEDYCSLRPNEDRLAVVKCMRISPEGEIVDFHEEHAVIRSRARLTYEQVDEYLCNPRCSFINDVLHGDLDALHEAYQTLKDASQARNELNLEGCKTVAHVNDIGHVTGFTDVYKTVSRDLIEKMMVAAGGGAGNALAHHGAADVIYRVHAEPPQNRIAKVCGLRLDNASNDDISLSTTELNEMLSQITQGKYAASHMNASVLSILSRGRYSPYQRPHFGLALPLYTQVTSPIRRYADLIAQRAECHAYDLEPENAVNAYIDLNAAATHLNNREEIVDKAHQEILQRCALAWLSGRVGQTVSAHIVTQNCQSIVLGIDGCPIRLEAKPDAPSRYGWATPNTYFNLRKWLDKATDTQKDHIPLVLKGACPLKASLSLDLKPWLQPEGPKQRILDICP